jgi:hypothetical protein
MVAVEVMVVRQVKIQEVAVVAVLVVPEDMVGYLQTQVFQVAVAPPTDYFQQLLV